LFLELFLDEEQIEKLHDFEEDCMDDLTRTKEFAKSTSMDERIRRTFERLVNSKFIDLSSFFSAPILYYRD
jgi:hypothetical protein